jgi:hypothetical protein
MGLPQMQDYDAFNPYIPGVSSTGSNFLYEPLYYYNAYGEEDNLIPGSRRAISTTRIIRS